MGWDDPFKLHSEPSPRCPIPTTISASRDLISSISSGEKEDPTKIDKVSVWIQSTGVIIALLTIVSKLVRMEWECTSKWMMLQKYNQMNKK